MSSPFQLCDDGMTPTTTAWKLHDLFFGREICGFNVILNKTTVTVLEH